MPNEAVQAKKVNQQYFDPHLLDSSGYTDQAPHTVRDGLVYGGGTFANHNILQQVIPEQMHEETYRNPNKLINTGQFQVDRSFEE